MWGERPDGERAAGPVGAELALSVADIRQSAMLRDAAMCVRCGAPVIDAAASLHHRQLQDRSNNAACNVIMLCGTGGSASPRQDRLLKPSPSASLVGCHAWVHGNSKRAQHEGGWIVSRHIGRQLIGMQRQLIGMQPVLYNQPLRTGWFLLNDDFTLTEYEAA